MSKRGKIFFHITLLNVLSYIKCPDYRSFIGTTKNVFFNNFPSVGGLYTLVRVAVG